MSTSLSTRFMYFPSSGDADSASPDEQHHVLGHRARAPRRLGRIVLIAIIAVSALGGITWQLHRSTQARRAELAMEMRAFEQRTQALRAEMSTLQDRIAQTRDQLGNLHVRAAQPAQPAQPAQSHGARPAAPVRRPAAARPRPSQQARPARPTPAPIVLTPGCADTPLGC